VPDRVSKLTLRLQLPIVDIRTRPKLWLLLRNKTIKLITKPGQVVNMFKVTAPKTTVLIITVLITTVPITEILMTRYML
jgi:hypothetical protein